VLDAEGHGYISDVIAAIDYAIRSKIATTSASSTCRSPPACSSRMKTDALTRAAKRAVDAGIVVVAAARQHRHQRRGRDAVGGGITSPGNAPWVLTVGAESHQGTAKRSDDVLAAFSSRGPDMDRLRCQA
jgi:serine protease AprX